MKELYINIKDLNESYTKDYFEKKFKKDLVSVDELISLIEDLISEKDELQEKLEYLEQDIEDNYRPVSKAEQYCVNDSDFI